MNAVLKIFLSMSFSGGLLILALLLGKRFLKDKISRQWQYYIWLVVVLRMLLPFETEVNLLGKTYQTVARTITHTVSLPSQQLALDTLGTILAPVTDLEQNNEILNPPVENLTTVHPLQEIWVLLTNHVWLIWLVVALGLLMRKVTIYQGFIRYLKAGLTSVSDLEILDRLSITAKQIGIQKPVELYVNPLISSPLLIGFFHSCIVLPSADISEKDLQYIVLHELTHYKRGDIFYKWLVQITVCLHWFNPLVYLMSREITKACEFSCDEAVLTKTGADNAQDYGKTLLDAMAAIGKYKENLGAVTLSENKQLLKERLGAIMNFKKKSTTMRLLTGVLTLCVIFGAIFVGVYPTAATTDKPQSIMSRNHTQGNAGANRQDYASQAEQYYEAGNLPLFQIVFSHLNEEAQEKWLKTIYADGDFTFFSVAIRGLDTNSSLFVELAEKAYADEEIAFFSILADCMNEVKLEFWLDQALEDGKWNFQSMLFNKLDKNHEFDELKEEKDKEWDAAQKTEYQAVGITMNGKDYYYQGQLVNIFLDIHANKFFYTLNMNPMGIINIKITRDADNQITDVTYMTELEVMELLKDMGDDDWQKSVEDKISHSQIIPVNLETVVDGEIVWLGEYTLSDGDRIWYDVLAEMGNGLQVGLVKHGDIHLNTTYYCVKNLRQQDEALKCTANFTFKPPVESGTYKLFLRATDGTLENVRGSISIGFVTKAA